MAGQEAVPTAAAAVVLVRSDKMERGIVAKKAVTD
jgi:hypothetical protein